MLGYSESRVLKSLSVGDAFSMTINIPDGYSQYILYFDTSYTTYNCVINWGDGTTSVKTDSLSSISHFYATSGDYVISISGDCGGLKISTNTSPYNQWIMSINNWGDINLQGVYAYGCSQLEIIPEYCAPDSIPYNGAILYYGCTNLPGVLKIPDHVTDLSNGSTTFSTAASITGIIYNTSGITEFGKYIFYGCYGLQTIEIPTNSLFTEIPRRTFYYCTSLSTITVPNNVTTIGDECFYGCGALYDVSLSENLNYIGSYAFRNCNNGALIVKCYALTPPALGSYVFYNMHSNFRIAVPAASINDYKTAAGWSSYATRIIAL